MIEGSRSWSGSRRPKNMWIRWIRIRSRIRNTDMYFVWCRYEEPVSDVSALQRMRNTPEYDRKASVPVKAAPKDASCSRFQASDHRASVPLVKPVLRMDLWVVLWIRNDFFFFGSVSGPGSYFSVGVGSYMTFFSNIININFIFAFPSCVLDCVLWREISFFGFFYIKEFTYIFKWSILLRNCQILSVFQISFTFGSGSGARILLEVSDTNERIRIQHCSE